MVSKSGSLDLSRSSQFLFLVPHETYFLTRSVQCNASDHGSIPGSGRSPGKGIDCPLQYSWASLVAQLVKNLSAMQETWVQSLGGEDPLEKAMATHSSILAWKIPWTEPSPWGVRTKPGQPLPWVLGFP